MQNYLIQISSLISKTNINISVALGAIFFCSIFYTRNLLSKIFLTFVTTLTSFLIIHQSDLHHAFMMFEALVMLAFFAIVYSKSSLKQVCAHYLGSMCIGSIIVIIHFVSLEFVNHLIANSFVDSLQIAYDYIFAIGILFCIGGIPFIHWNIYGYSNLSTFNLLSIFSTILTISIILLTKNIKHYFVLEYIAKAISLYIALILLFERNFKRLSSYFNIYLFANAIFLMTKDGKSDKMGNVLIFVLLTLSTIVCCNIILRNRFIKNPTIGGDIYSKVAMLIFIFIIGLSVIFEDEIIISREFIEDIKSDKRKILNMMTVIKLFTMSLVAIKLSSFLTYIEVVKKYPKNIIIKKIFEFLLLLILLFFASLLLLYKDIANLLARTGFSFARSNVLFFIISISILFPFRNIFFAKVGNKAIKILTVRRVYVTLISWAISVISAIMKFFTLAFLEYKISLVLKFRRFTSGLSISNIHSSISTNFYTVLFFFVQIILVIAIECVIRK